MATEIQVVIDCADPAKLSKFWAEALHYVLQDPPAGFDTWHEYLRSEGAPEESWNDAGAIVDPDGERPRIYFQRVPEPKTVKNRVHLDINVGPGISAPLAERRRVVDEEVERLTVAGPRSSGPVRSSGASTGWSSRTRKATSSACSRATIRPNLSMFGGVIPSVVKVTQIEVAGSTRN